MFLLIEIVIYESCPFIYILIDTNIANETRCASYTGNQVKIIEKKKTINTSDETVNKEMKLEKKTNKHSNETEELTELKGIKKNLTRRKKKIKNPL